MYENEMKITYIFAIELGVPEMALHSKHIYKLYNNINISHQTHIYIDT